MMAKIPVEIFKFLYSVCSEKSEIQQNIKTEPEPEKKPFFKKPVPEPEETFFLEKNRSRNRMAKIPVEIFKFQYIVAVKKVKSNQI